MKDLYSYWLFTAVTGVPALILALILERRRARQNAGTLPYTTGLVISLNALIAGIVIVLAQGIAFLTHRFSGKLNVIAFGILLIIAGVYGIRRARVGLIAATLLTLNPLWYIIGLMYIPRRWNELGGMSSVVHPDGRTKRRVYRNMY